MVNTSTCVHIFIHILKYIYIAPVVYYSGNPRMLLVLVLEFESRRGEILNIFAKIEEEKEKKGSTELLRARSVGKHNSTRVDEGRKS